MFSCVGPGPGQNELVRCTELVRGGLGSTCATADGPSARVQRHSELEGEQLIAMARTFASSVQCAN